MTTIVVIWVLATITPLVTSVVSLAPDQALEACQLCQDAPQFKLSSGVASRQLSYLLGRHAELFLG